MKGSSKQSASGPRWYELRLVTLLALLLMVGAWSWAQRREVAPPQYFGNYFTSANPSPGTSFVGPESAQYGFRLPATLPADSSTIEESPGQGRVAASDELSGSSVERDSENIDGANAETSGEVEVGAWTVAVPTARLVGGTTFGTNAPAYEYRWPTANPTWNVLVGVLLVVATAVVVERLARRRMRTSLGELLLAVTAAAVSVALVKSYWAETAVAARVILLAGTYCGLLVAAHGLALGVRALINGLSRLRV